MFRLCMPCFAATSTFQPFKGQGERRGREARRERERDTAADGHGETEMAIAREKDREKDANLALQLKWRMEDATNGLHGCVLVRLSLALPWLRFCPNCLKSRTSFTQAHSSV